MAFFLWPNKSYVHCTYPCGITNIINEFPLQSFKMYSESSIVCYVSLHLLPHRSASLHATATNCLSVEERDPCASSCACIMHRLQFKQNRDTLLKTLLYSATSCQKVPHCTFNTQRQNIPCTFSVCDQLLCDDDSRKVMCLNEINSNLKIDIRLCARLLQ